MHVKHSTDMTVGAISPLLIKFALPLLAGNLFQQLYNTVDSIVVGNYVGKEALAAVGASVQLIRVLIGFFMGLATGGGVVVSQYFGAHDNLRLRHTVHTMILGTIIMGAVFTVVGLVASPFMLRLISTPDDVFVEATTYLRIFFLGIIFLMVYNMGAGILRAVGDSSHPFYYLVVSSLLNVLLDIVFVVIFKMGVAGVAYATVIAQAVSTVLVLYFLFHANEPYSLSLKHMRLNLSSAKKILRIGLPGGIQMAVTSFSNVFVQAYINHFGSACMAGWTSYMKLDQFAMLPMQSLAMSASTFVGQNYGAHKMERLKQGITSSMHISILITGIISALLFLSAKLLIMLFNRDADVIYYGVYFLHACSPFYALCCVNQIYAACLRGLGNATKPVIIMLFSFVVFRQVLLFVLTHLTSAFWPVSIAFPSGWVMCTILMTIYYHYASRKIFKKILG